MKAKLRLAAVGVGLILVPFIVFKVIKTLSWSSDLETSVISNVHSSRRLNQPKYSFLDEERGNKTIEEDIDINVPPTSKTCRNSVQGKTILTDERGYVCTREHIELSTGCCQNNSETKRYVCTGCTNGCCDVFEHCVSCCLQPKNKTALKKVLAEATAHSDILLLSVSDHFELCLAKCRTNSRSVQHENLYINQGQKYCFMAVPPRQPPGQDTIDSSIGLKVP